MIKLVPVGSTDKAILEILKKPIEEAFGTSVRTGNRMELPEASWNAQRRQYLTSLILDKLPLDNRVLGVVDVDIYHRGLNFVFGQADVAGQRAIISPVRLRQEFYGLPRDDKLFCERVIKEAVHELGHTYSLEHCHRPTCVMHFSNSLQDTDFKGRQFCSICREKVRGAGI